MMLKFQFGNAKLIKRIAIFSLPAGHTCPFARECSSRTDRITGKIIDGEHCRFRCSAAGEERYPAVRALRWHNLEFLRELKSVEKMASRIASDLPATDLVRLHPSGDFYTEAYFLAWLNVALNFPNKLFYAYTKALPLWLKYRRDIPANFKLVASYGGTHDHLIAEHELRYSKVVFSEEEADELGLAIDKTDSMAYGTNVSFALLLHGHQPAGTPAAKAWYKLMRAGKGYSIKRRQETARILKNIQITIKRKETAYA